MLLKKIMLPLLLLQTLTAEFANVKVPVDVDAFALRISAARSHVSAPETMLEWTVFLGVNLYDSFRLQFRHAEEKARKEISSLLFEYV